MKFKFKKSLHLWYAVDEDGRGFLFEEKPERKGNIWTNSSTMYNPEDLQIDIENLPNLDFENEPKKIKITTTIYW